MSEQSDVNFALGWTRMTMKIYGAWPDPNIEDEWFTKFLAALPPFIQFFFIIIPQMVNLFKIWPDIDMATKIMVYSLTTAIPAIRLSIVYMNKKALKLLVGSIYDDWNHKRSDWEWKIMRSNAELSRKIFVFCFIFMNGTVMLYFFPQFYQSFGGLVEDRQLFYPAYFPYDTSKSPIYELTCCIQFMGGTFCSFIYIGVTSFIGILILHLNGQFIILQFTVEMLINNNDLKKLNEFQASLKFIVEKHKHLNRFASTIEDTFNEVLLLEMISSSIQLCLQGYQVIGTVNASVSIPLKELFFLMFYIFLTLSNLYVICYMGEKLEVVNSRLGFSVYDSEWYNLKAIEARDLMMLFEGTRKPLQITAGKFVAFSLETFAAVIKRAMGYLSVLLTVNQNRP